MSDGITDGYKMQRDFESELESDRLKYRMYGLVPYNLSEIAKGIQFGHAVVEYGNDFGHNMNYRQWSREDKTFIILNGGTTNTNPNSFGSLNLYMKEFRDIGYEVYAAFYEPDLGDQLTAFVFLANEKCWDYEKYPTFGAYISKQEESFNVNNGNYTTRHSVYREYDEDKYYQDLLGEDWKQIIEMRNFLNSKKLA